MYATDGVLKRPTHAGSYQYAPYGVGAAAGAGAAVGQASPRPTKKPRIRTALTASKRNKDPIHLPEVRDFERLVQLEKQLDVAKGRHLHLVQEGLLKPQRVLKTMRVRLHHSCKYLDEDGAGAPASGSGNDGQANAGDSGKQTEGAEQKSGADASAATGTAPAAPRRVQWKLRFDCTFSGAQNPGLFLSFFKRFVMELDYKTYPEYRAEWIKAGERARDVFGARLVGHAGAYDSVLKTDYTRGCELGEDCIKVTREVNATPETAVSIQGFLYFGTSSGQMLLSPDLAAIVGSPVATKGYSLLAVWQHAKAAGLIDAASPHQIRMDDALAKLFGSTDAIAVSTLEDRIAPYLSASPPLRLSYTFNVNHGVGDTVWEIPVEVEDPILAHWGQVLKRSTSAWESDERELALVSQQIDKKLHEINQSRLRRSFMLAFARSPAAFVHKLIESQSRDLVAMTEGLDGELDEEVALNDNRLFNNKWVFEAAALQLHKSGLAASHEAGDDHGEGMDDGARGSGDEGSSGSSDDEEGDSDGSSDDDGSDDDDDDEEEDDDGGHEDASHDEDDEDDDDDDDSDDD